MERELGRGVLGCRFKHEVGEKLEMRFHGEVVSRGLW